MTERAGGTLLRGLLVSLLTFALLGALVAAAEWESRRAVGDAWRADEHSLSATLEFELPCFEVEGSGDGARLVRNPVASPPVRPMELPLARTPGVTRLAIIGESNAALLGDDIQERLGRAECGRRYEVLNCGAQGASIDVVDRRLDEVLRYRPDAVLMVFGHNFRYGGGHPPPTPRWRLRLIDIARRSALAYRIVKALPMRPTERGPNAVRAKSNSPVDVALAQSQSALIAVEREIGELAERARAHGVPLIASTLTPNLLMPPAIVPSDLREPALLEAYYLEATRGRTEALRYLIEKSEAEPSALQEFQIGDWLLSFPERVGEARAHFWRAVELDGVLARAPEGMNAFLRALAAKHELRLRDAEAAISARAPQHIAGWDLLHDACHLLPEPSDREAEALFAELRDAARGPECALAPPREHPDLAYSFMGAEVMMPIGAEGFRDRRHWPLSIAEALRRRFLLDGAELPEKKIRELLDTAMVRDAPPVQRADTLEGIAAGCREAGRSECAVHVNELARAIPGVSGPWVQRGLWLLGAQPAEARAAFEKALAIDPARADAAYYLRRMDGR